jgi:hypothetical protein
MAFADYKPRRVKITFDGGSASVRAISLMDVATIIDSHQWAVEQCAARIRAGLEVNGQVTEAMLAELTMDLIRESPTLAGNIIALAADESDPASMRAAATLPVTVQLEALLAIGELTFKDLAAVKKLVAGVKMLIRGLLPPAAVPPAKAA